MTTLGYVANSSLGYSGQEYRYETEEWKVLERLASSFEHVVICAPVVDLRFESDDVRGRFAHHLDVPNGRVVNLAPARPTDGLWRWIQYRLWEVVILFRQSRTWSVGFIMAPGWKAVSAWIVRMCHRWPFGIYFRGDWPARVRARLGPRPNPLGRLYIRWLEQLEKQMLTDADVRIAEGRLFAARYPELDDSVIPSVTVDIPLERFRRKRDRCKVGAVRLISIGSLEPRKGFGFALEAVAALRNCGVDVSYSLIGDGPARSSLEESAARLGLNEAVTFEGYVSGQEAVLQRLEGADILLVPSLSEGFPRVIYEAMSQSVLVVATSVGAIPSNLSDEIHALLIPPSNSNALAYAIARLVADPELRQRILTHAYELAWSTFQSDPTARIERAMHQLAYGSGRRLGPTHA